MPKVWVTCPDTIRTSTGERGSVTSHLEMTQDGTAYRAVIDTKPQPEHPHDEVVKTSVGMVLCGRLAADKERELLVYERVGDDVVPAPKGRFL